MRPQCGSRKKLWKTKLHTHCAHSFEELEGGYLSGEIQNIRPSGSQLVFRFHGFENCDVLLCGVRTRELLRDVRPSFFPECTGEIRICGKPGDCRRQGFRVLRFDCKSSARFFNDLLSLTFNSENDRARAGHEL